MRVSNILYLFVENFTTDKREEFFEKELPYLTQHFEKVYVIPFDSGNNNLIYTNQKIEILHLNAFKACKRPEVFFKNFSLILKILSYEFFKTHSKLYYIKNFPSLLNRLVLRIASANNIEETIKNNSNAVFYTYWFSQWTFILSLLKEKYPHIKLVTRAHGSDYKEEQTGTTLPFRYYQLKKVDAIFPVSDYAKKYLEKKFGVNPNKIFVSRLGINHPAHLGPVNGSELVLVTCSSLVSLKRVHLLPEILKHINIQTTWHHFGEGPALDKIKESAAKLPQNIAVHLHGHIPNRDFMDFICNNPISFFINVSEYEGIPVSLMEAASVGIPLIGCNTGGVGEIVTTTTGMLFPIKLDVQEVAAYILACHKEGTIYSEPFRLNVGNWGKKHFHAETNYNTLGKKLAEYGKN